MTAITADPWTIRSTYLGEEHIVVTLHIEHAVTDYGTWKQAFDRFTDMRRDSGVTHHRIHRPADDEQYVLIDLDFDSGDEASKFLNFLTTTVWPTPANAPALAGAPLTRILNLMEVAGSDYPSARGRNG